MHSQKRKFTDTDSENTAQHSDSPTFRLPSISKLLAPDTQTIEEAALMLSSFALVAQSHNSAAGTAQALPIDSHFSQDTLLPQQAAPLYFFSSHFEHPSNIDQTNSAPQPVPGLAPQKVRVRQVTFTLIHDEEVQAKALGFTTQQLYQISSGDGLEEQKARLQNFTMLKKLLDPSNEVLSKLLQVKDIDTAIITKILTSTSGDSKIMLLLFLLGKELSWETGPIHSFLTTPPMQIAQKKFDSKRVLELFCRKDGNTAEGLALGVFYKEKLMDLGFGLEDIPRFALVFSSHLKLPLLLKDLHENLRPLYLEGKSIQNIEGGQKYMERMLTLRAGCSATVPQVAEIIVAILKTCGLSEKETESYKITNLAKDGIRCRQIPANLAKEAIATVIQQANEYLGTELTQSPAEKRQHDDEREDNRAANTGFEQTPGRILSFSDAYQPPKHKSQLPHRNTPQPVTDILSPRAIKQATALGFSYDQLNAIVLNGMGSKKNIATKYRSQNIAILNNLFDPPNTILNKLLQVQDINVDVITDILRQNLGGYRMMLLLFLLGKEASWERGPIHSFLLLPKPTDNCGQLNTVKVLEIFARNRADVSRGLAFGILHQKELASHGFTERDIVQLASGKSPHPKVILIVNDLAKVGNIRDMPEGGQYMRDILLATRGLSDVAAMIIKILEKCGLSQEGSLSSQLLSNEQATIKNRLVPSAQAAIENLVQQVEQEWSEAHFNTSQASSTQLQTLSYPQKRPYDGLEENGAGPSAKKVKITIL